MITKRDVEECIKYLEERARKDAEISKLTKERDYSIRVEGISEGYQEAANYLKDNLLSKVKKGGLNG